MTDNKPTILIVKEEILKIKNFEQGIMRAEQEENLRKWYVTVYGLERSLDLSNSCLITNYYL